VVGHIAVVDQIAEAGQIAEVVEQMAVVDEQTVEVEVGVAGLANNWVGNFAEHLVEGTLVDQIELEDITEAFEGLHLVGQMG
jgi:hypothetical protein